MSNDCFKYQLSFKFGEYDNAMLNVRADTEEELAHACSVVNRQAGNLAVAAETVRAVAMGGSGAPVPSVDTSRNAGAPTAPVPAQPAPAAPQGAAPAYLCAHGARVKRSGGQGAEAWEGWFCPLSKDRPDRCKPVYPGR